ncbi:MAG: GNAT family N-acetyltransferase [Pseudomonadota bacterium]
MSQTDRTIKIIRHPTLTDHQINALFNASWPDWSERSFQPILRQSLDYLGAFDNACLIGFVNLAWDGGCHGFIVDTTVHPDHRRQGIALLMLRELFTIARENNLQWLHADFESAYQRLYEKAGFRMSAAGVQKVADSHPADSDDGQP